MAVASKFVFAAYSGTAGRELWISDGTDAGTVLLKDIAPGLGGSDPSIFSTLPDGRVLFAATDNGGGRELWVTDGTNAGTALIKDIVPGIGSSNPSVRSVLADGRVLFVAADAANGAELWITDGTASGTALLKDINPGVDGSSPTYASGLPGGRYVFQATDPQNGSELWVTDGTPDGTLLLKDIAPGRGGSNPFSFGALADGRILLQATDGVSGTELWVTDGTAAGTTLIKDINPGPGNSFPQSGATLPDGRVVFTAVTDALNYEVWVTDGTAAGTQLLKDIAPAANGGFPFDYTAAGNGKLVFRANSGSEGSELWVTDGTPAGTVLLKDISIGGVGSLDDISSFQFARVADGRLVFRADDGVHGTELWVTDGTAAGTTLLKDVNPGAGAGLGNAFTSTFTRLADGRLLFSANDGALGIEPWVTDGTAAGTVLLRDVAGGAGASSNPSAGAQLLGDLAPAAPRAVSLDASSDSSTPGDNLTNDTTPTLTGTAATGSTVTVYGNATVLGTTAVVDGSGVWRFTPGAALGEGTHAITAVAINAGGVASAPSAALQVRIDASGPAAAVIAGLAAASDSGVVGDGITNDTTPTLTGSAEAGSTVRLTATRGGVASAFGTAVADAAGRWSVTPATALAEGTAAITAVVTDTAGNVSAASAPFALTVSVVEVVTGTDGDDRFTDKPVNQLFIGLGGRDTLVLAEGRRGVTFVLNGENDASLSRNGQVDAVRGVEAIQFLDGQMVFDPGHAAASVVRLYQAGLGRAPDQGGLNFWTANLQHGVPLAGLASGFLSSPEFVSRFGTGLSNNDFVTRVYRNVLGREPEADGLAFWRGNLDNGASTRAATLAGISESAENREVTKGLLATGVWDVSETAAQVARLYDTALGRLPDASGLGFWTSRIDTGGSLLELANSFINSAEFIAVYGALDNRAFVTTVYANTLDRPGEQQGVDFWTAALNGGTSRAQVVIGFSESLEHQQNTASNITSNDPASYGIRLAA